MSNRRDTLLNRPDLVARRAADAVSKAFKLSLSRGFSVTYAQNGVLYVESADGTKQVIGRVGEDG